MAERTVRRVRSTRNIRGSGAKKKDDGFSLLGAALTPAEWLINQVSRPAYSIGSLVAGNPANAVREMGAFFTLGASELIPGMDAPETTVSQALQQRGVNFGSGVPGFLLRFGTDIVTDPTSYVSFGTSGAVRQAGRSAVKKATAEASEDLAARGVRGDVARAEMGSRARGAEIDAKRSLPRQFAVEFSPLGFNLARRGKPIASRDIVLEDSAIGRQIDAALRGISMSRPGRSTQRVFATGGDPTKINRVVDGMAQAIRQQGDRVKNDKLARVLRRQADQFDKAAKSAGIKNEDAARSIGAWMKTRKDAQLLGVPHADAYANYVRNVKEGTKSKTTYMPFADVEQAFGRQIRFADSAFSVSGKREVAAGVKTTDDLIDDYVPAIGRKGKDQRKANEIENYTAQTNALRSSTTQQRRVLKTTQDWFDNGLIPEDDIFRLVGWRMNQSVDLIAQQTLLNAVSSRFGRVLDEAEILNKLRTRQGKSIEKFQKAANVAGKARDALSDADREVVQQALRIGDERANIAALRAGDAQSVARAQGDLDVVRGVQRENPLPTMAEAGAAAAARAEGPTFADLQTIAQDRFDARQFLQMARNELARRRVDVDTGLDNSSVLGPYQRLVVKAEDALKRTYANPARMSAEEATALKNEAINLLRGEQAARRVELKQAQDALRKARRQNNKVAIARAQGRVNEAKLRQRLARERVEKARVRAGTAQRRLADRARILQDDTTRLADAEALAQRTLKTPGARASAKEFAEYKKQGWQQLQYDYDSVSAVVSPEVREAVDNAFQKAWEITTDRGAFASAKQFVNSATSRWKGLALISVGYHMRNLQSDLMMAWIAGAKDPRSIAQAVQIMRGRSGSIVVNGQRMTYDDIRALFPAKAPDTESHRQWLVAVADALPRWVAEERAEGTYLVEPLAILMLRLHAVGETERALALLATLEAWAGDNPRYQLWLADVARALGDTAKADAVERELFDRDSLNLYRIEDVLRRIAAAEGADAALALGEEKAKLLRQPVLLEALASIAAEAGKDDEALLWRKAAEKSKAAAQQLAELEKAEREDEGDD